MAAYCAKRRLGDVDLTQADTEDLIQTAALVYWKHLRADMPVPYRFVAARVAGESILTKR